MTAITLTAAALTSVVGLSAALGAFAAGLVMSTSDWTGRRALQEVIPIRDVEHGIAVANESVFGLGSSVWTRDIGVAHRFARDVEAGMVWINTYFDQDPTAPWGGYKQSGNGRDKCLEALTHYSQTKSVWLNFGT